MSAKAQLRTRTKLFSLVLILRVRGNIKISLFLCLREDLDFYSGIAAILRQVMVTVVVVINTLISLVLFYVARRVWRLRRRITRIANILDSAERKTARLAGAPAQIIKGQQTLQRLRQKTQPLEVQIARVRQIVKLLVVGQQIWRQSLLWSRMRKRL